jgi:catechol 2,3-dioxygenase-like lactoylglutathione lyase family enzyme
MIDRTGVIVSDLAKSQAFYSAALGAMGISLLKELPASVTGRADVVGYGAEETTAQGVSPEFWLSQGIPGNVPVHLAFRVGNRALVDAFYQAALAAGGRGNGRARIATAISPQLLWRLSLTRTGITSKPFAVRLRKFCRRSERTHLLS